MKKWYSIQNLADSSASISIRGIVGDWGLTDKDLIDAINALGQIDLLEVRINSNGGDLMVALGLFNYLRNHPAKITTYVEGVAASAASVIAMAGDIIIMPSNTVMMIHNPWSVVAGSSSEMAAAAEMLAKMEQTLITTYEARTKRSFDEIKAMLNKETWLTAQEAFELGFCDQVQDISEGYAIAMAKASGIPQAVLNKLQHTEKPENSQDAENDLKLKEQEALDANSALDESVQNLCEAAGQLDILDPMKALAKSYGLESVQAVLQKTLIKESSGINPFHSLVSEKITNNQQKDTQSKLAVLSLNALKRK